MKNIAIFISCLLLITACSGRPHPKMLSFTPASVVIDYTDNDMHEATSMAQQFCASINKDAQYVRTEEGGWFSGVLSRTRHAYFNCIESSKNANTNNAGTSSTGAMPIINNFK